MVFRLVNNDTDTNTSVTIDHAEDHLLPMPSLPPSSLWPMPLLASFDTRRMADSWAHLRRYNERPIAGATSVANGESLWT